MTQTSNRSDIYTRITDKIVADLEQGVRPWLKPWNTEHVAGRITRPLRHNGIPYNGINVIMLWSAAVAKDYSCPLWLTFKQAMELGSNVRRGESGELVVYADRVKRTEIDTRGRNASAKFPSSRVTPYSMPNNAKAYPHNTALRPMHLYCPPCSG